MLATKNKVVHLTKNNNIMKRPELAQTLGLNSPNSIKNWCEKLRIKVPSDFDNNHVTMFQIYKSLSERQPKLDESVIIQSLLPFMRLAKVEPVDPATHPLTSGAPSASADGEEVENPMIPLVVDAMEQVAVELAPVAGAALIQGFAKNPEAKGIFKTCLAASVRGGVEDWLAKNVPTITVSSVPADESTALSGKEGANQKALEGGE